MKKPNLKYSNSKKMKGYAVSIYLQLLGYFVAYFSGRKVTHAFYYSDSQKKIGLDHLESFLDHEQHITTCFGKEYTEMRRLECGWCNWKDSKLVGLGSSDDVHFAPPDWSELENAGLDKKLEKW